jgi:hypothetical protein
VKSIPVVLLLFAFTSFAAEPRSPYAGQELRDVKALSNADIEAYLAGKGMGYAKAAELNSYPGPKHVLELSKELDLTDLSIWGGK